MTDDNTFNESKIDTRVNEAAEKYANEVQVTKASKRVQRFIRLDLESAFIAGVNWQLETSKNEFKKFLFDKMLSKIKIKGSKDDNSKTE